MIPSPLLLFQSKIPINKIGKFSIENREGVPFYLFFFTLYFIWICCSDLHWSQILMDKYSGSFIQNMALEQLGIGEIKSIST